MNEFPQWTFFTRRLNQYVCPPFLVPIDELHELPNSKPTKSACDLLRHIAREHSESAV